MSFKRFIWLNAMFERDDLNSKDLLVGSFLFRKVNADAVAFPTVVEIADRCKINRKTVLKSISELEKTGLIRREKTGGNRNRYVLSSPKPDPSVVPNEYPSQKRPLVPKETPTEVPNETHSSPKPDPQTEHYQNKEQNNFNPREDVVEDSPSVNTKRENPNFRESIAPSKYNLESLGLPMVLLDRERVSRPWNPRFEFLDCWKRFTGRNLKFGNERILRQLTVLCNHVEGSTLHEAIQASSDATNPWKYFLAVIENKLGEAAGIPNPNVPFPWNEKLLEVGFKSAEQWAGTHEDAQRIMYQRAGLTS